MKGGSATKLILDAVIGAAAASLGRPLAPAGLDATADSITSFFLACEAASARVYAGATADGLASLVRAAGDALRGGGRVLYLGVGVHGVLGVIGAGRARREGGALNSTLTAIPPTCRRVRVPPDLWRCL